MSQPPPYNPYNSGNQRSTRGSYGLTSMQAERDPRRATSGLGPGSSFSSSAASSATPANAGRRILSLLNMSVSYRPDQSRAGMDKDKEGPKDTHSSSAREEVRFVGQPDHHPIGQSTRYTSTQRDDILSSGTGTTSYSIASTSASLGHRHPDVDGGSRSLDWFPKYKKAATDDSSKFYPSTASSSYTSSGGSKFNFSSDRERDVQSIPGLGDFDYPVQDKPPTETSRPKYTSECASNILLQFGLEKEDLEYLVSYPDDQMTPANLPFILRQIRNQKAKRSSTAVESEPYPETRPIRGMSGMGSLSSSGGSSAVLQPAKVIDYGHTGNYAGGVVDEIGRTSGSGGSGSLSLVDTRDSRSNHSQDRTEVKSSALGSSRGQGSSVTNSSYNSILRSVAPLSSDPAQRLKTPLGSSSLPRKDSDRTFYTSEASKSRPSKEPGPQSASKSQPPCTLFRSVHPDRPSLVLIGSNETIENRRAIQGKGSSVAEQQQTQMLHNQTQLQQRQMLQKPTQQKPTKQKQSQLHQNQKQQNQRQQNQRQQDQRQQDQRQQDQRQPNQRQQDQRQQDQRQQDQRQQDQRQQNQKQPNQRQPKQTQQKQPASLMGRAMRPLDFSAVQSVPPAPVIPSNTKRSGFVPLSCAIPPPQPVQSQGPAKRPVAKGLPARFMVYDYAAVTPKVFPHTCTLCCKECTSIKEWHSHQSSSLHLDTCRVFREKYPEWNGDIELELSTGRRETEPSSTTYQQRPKKTNLGSRSRSPSPRRGRRSRTRSPRSARYTLSSLSRSRSPRCDRNRSRSRSHERQWRRDDRRSSSRSAERWSSPGRSRERRPSPRRREDKRSSPRRSRERRPSPRRRDDKRPSPGRSHDRQPSPRRRDDNRSSPRRSDERCSSPKRSRKGRTLSETSPGQKKASSAETLAKNLLKTSAVQSLSKQSDLEAVVKCLAPALLAELAKMKSSSSTSSTSTKGGKSAGRKSSSSAASSSASTAAAKKKQTTTTTTTSTKANSEASASSKSQVDEDSPPNVVKLKGVHGSFSHAEVVTAVEQFGKTISVVLFRSKREAVVRFEKDEDAKKLKSEKSIAIKGFPVTVVKETDDEQKTPQKKPTVSSVSTPPTSKATKTTMPQRNTTYGKRTNEKTVAKGSTKVTKANILVAKAKNASTKPIAKRAKPAVEQVDTAEVDESANVTVAEPTQVSESVTEVKVKEETASSSAAGAMIKEEVEEKSATPTKETLKSTNSGNQTDVETSESKELDTKVQPSVQELEDTVKVEPGNEIVSELKHQAEPAKVKAEVKEDAEPMALGETGVEVAEPMEVEPRAEVKVEQLTSTEAVTDKPSESRPPPSTDENNAPTVLPPKAEADGRPADTSGPKPPEAPDEASSQLLEPESVAPVLEVKMEASQPSSSAEGMEENTIEKDPVSAVTSQSDPVSADDASEPVGHVSTKPTTEVVSRQRPTATSSKSVSFETADSSVETRVVENFDTFSTDSASEGVARLETRLENSSEVALEAETPTEHTPSELSDNGPQLVLQTSSPPSAEPAAPDESITREDVTVESSATAAGDVEMEADGKKLGAEIVLDSTVGPQVANEDIEEVAEREEGSPTARDATADAAFGPTHSSEETTAELPQIDQDTFTALVAALHQHRLTKETRALSDKKEARGDAYDCDEQNFNMNDFVTVDEVVGDDSEETSPDPRRSASSKRPSRGRKEPQSSDASSDDKRPSTRSSRDSKRSSSSSSSSSKSTKDSTKRSSSSNSTKDSSRSTKSSTRPSSSLLSPETPSSSDHKTQQSKTRPPVKASKTSSSSCRTRSSRSSETLPESQREDVEATESAVPTSDHRVSAEGIAANAVESETKIETSPETHPPAQGQGLGLNQDQNLETDFKDNTLNDLDKVNDNSETCPEKCSEMELDSSLQTVDGATQNQAQQLFEKEQPLNVCDRKDPKDLTGDVTQQETFEMLDSIDDQTAIDNDTSGAQISKEDIGRIEEEEDTSRSGLRTRQDRTETSTKIVYEMDSVKDQPVHDATATERSVRRRSQRGKKEDKTEVSEKPDGDAEASFEVLDSVEDETATEEPTTTTSTRGRRGRTSKKDSQVDKTKEEDTPTTRRCTPARESQEAKKSDITVQESRDEDATYEILDSVEDEEVVKDDRPATGGRGKRGRPKKAVKATKNETVTLKKGDTEKEADGEEVSFQILDSVEDEMVDDHPSTEQSVSARKKKTSKKDKLVQQSSSLSGSPRNEEEEEPVYQIVDSVEDDQVQEESGKETSKTNDETCPKEEVPAVEEDSPTCSSVVVEGSEELVVKDSEDLSAGTLDEAGDDEKADEAEESPRSAKRKHDDEVTEESVNFVTVDEVEEEEEEEEEEQEAAPRTRGRPKKRTRKTPVRKSTRGNRDGAKDEGDDERESSGSDAPPLKDPSTLLSDGQREIQKSQGGGASQAHVGAASAGQDLQPDHPESQSLERCVEEGEEEEEEEEEEGWSRADVEVVTKRKSELVGPEAKRSRSQSPCAAADLNLPPFSPNNPLGQEFVVPKSGYFCNLCRVFYLNESSAKMDHCGSQRHYDNLQKYLQKHRHKPPTSSSPHSQGLASD